MFPSSSARPLYVIVLPVLVVGMLQLSGCTSRPVPLPPAGGTYFSASAGALFEQSVEIEGETGAYIARYPLQRAHRPAFSPQKVLIAAGGQGIVVSDNSGDTWRVLATPLNFVHDVILLPNGVLVASGINADGQGFVVRSIDEAKSWEVVLTIPLPVDTRGFQIIRVQEAPDSRVVSIELDPFNPDRIYAGSSLGSIFVGEQSAKTWRVEHQLDTRNIFTGSSAGLSIQDIIPSPHQAGELLLLTSARSVIRIVGDKQDELTIPRDVKNPQPFSITGRKRIFDIMYIAGFPNALYAGVDDGAVISRDRGTTWEQLPLPVDAIKKFNTGAVAVSPTNATRMLVAINSIIYRSEDSGRTWNSFSLGLPEHGITALLIDPQNASRVLAVTTLIGS